MKIVINSILFISLLLSSTSSVSLENKIKDGGVITEKSFLQIVDLKIKKNQLPKEIKNEYDLLRELEIFTKNTTLSFTKKETAKNLFLFYQIKEELKGKITNNKINRMKNKIKQSQNKYNYFLHGNIFIQMNKLLDSDNYLKYDHLKKINQNLLKDSNSVVKKQILESLNKNRQNKLFYNYDLEEMIDKKKARYKVSYKNVRSAKELFELKNIYLDNARKDEYLDSVVIKIKRNNSYLSDIDIYFYDEYIEDTITRNFVKNNTEDIIEIVNNERKKKNLKPLKKYEKKDYTDLRAKEISVKFSHERPDKSNFNSGMSQKYGVGENIAMGQKSAEEVMNDWLNSPRHRENILNPDFTYISIGFYGDSNTEYKFHWVQHFYM